MGDRLILKSVVRFIINLLIWSHSPVNVHPPALHRSRHPRPQDNSCFPSGWNKTWISFSYRLLLFRVTYIFQPFRYHRMAVGGLWWANPEARCKEVTVWNQPLGIRFYVADTATRARYNQTDTFTCHFRTVIEQEGLQWSRHIAPPKRSCHDDSFVLPEFYLYGINCRIRRSTAGIVPNRLNLCTTDGVVVRRIVDPFLRRLYPYYIGFDLCAQVVD